MNRPICCEGDATTHGGKVVKASGSYTIDGCRAARLGDIVLCPAHGPNPIIEGDSASLDEGLPIALHAHKTACGSALICHANATIAA